MFILVVLWGLKLGKKGNLVLTYTIALISAEGSVPFFFISIQAALLDHLVSARGCFWPACLVCIVQQLTVDQLTLASETDIGGIAA